MLKSIEPVLQPMRVAVMELLWRLWTWGLHPLHPDHGRIALRRASLKGGVNVR